MEKAWIFDAGIASTGDNDCQKISGNITRRISDFMITKKETSIALAYEHTRKKNLVSLITS